MVTYDARFWDEQWFNTTLPNGGIKFAIEAPNILSDGSRISDHINKVEFSNINQDFNMELKQPSYISSLEPDGTEWVGWTIWLGHHLWPVLGQWEIIVFSDKKIKYGASFEITEENMNYTKPTPAEGIQVIENPDGSLTVNATIPVYEPVAGGDRVVVVFRVLEGDDEVVFDKRWQNPTTPNFSVIVPAEFKGYKARFETREHGQFWPEYDFSSCVMRLGAMNRVIKWFKLETP